MFQLTRPSARDVEAHRDAQRSLDVTYTGMYATRGDVAVPAGYDHDRAHEELGRGEAVFRAAVAAIRAWTMFPPPLAYIEPAGIPIEVGQVAGVIIRAFGIWTLNAARIVYVIDEPRRFGFAYGTLPGHVEAGEELFLVSWLADDTVRYDIDAFSQPRYWPARIGKPVVRMLQDRFRRMSCARMLATVR